MLITSRRAAICQSVAEVQFTGVAPLRAVSHRFYSNFNMGLISNVNKNTLNIQCNCKHRCLLLSTIYEIGLFLSLMASLTKFREFFS